MSVVIVAWSSFNMDGYENVDERFVNWVYGPGNKMSYPSQNGAFGHFLKHFSDLFCSSYS